METSQEARPPTSRTGYVQLYNDWGADLSSVTVRHRRGNSVDRQEERIWDTVASGSPADGTLTIAYDAAGMLHPDHYDYWWIKLSPRTGEPTYVCKDDFFCSLTEQDDGKVWLTVDGAARKLHVRFSHSHGDSVELHPVRP